MTDQTKPGDPADKAIDAKADGAFQGSHRAGYGDRLARVEDWLRRYPSATLASGEGAVLLAEIDQLRAFIERVVALHASEAYTTPLGSRLRCRHCHDESGYRVPHPCPTLRALEGVVV